MNGLLLVSAFNRLRAQGIGLGQALELGFSQRIRPVMMTTLTAILGLLPAALSTNLGSETQRPLAVVVVGGMLCTIVCMVIAPMLYSFYGQRTPPRSAGDLTH
jgi:cobalt-zinc-cadmium resistance protein CzcA